MTDGRHNVHRYCDESGWRADCRDCDWSATARSREGREAVAYAHELAGTLTVRRIEETR